MTKITAKIANEIATRLNANVTKTRAFPIVLKSLIDACVQNDATFNDDAKKIRAKIRANKSIERVMNTSHIMHNVDELHLYRYTIDNAYRVAYDRAIERASNEKRETKSRKRATQSNDVVSNDVASDANENA